MSSLQQSGCTKQGFSGPCSLFPQRPIASVQRAAASHMAMLDRWQLLLQLWRLLR